MTEMFKVERKYALLRAAVSEAPSLPCNLRFYLTIFYCNLRLYELLFPIVQTRVIIEVRMKCTTCEIFSYTSRHLTSFKIDAEICYIIKTKRIVIILINKCLSVYSQLVSYVTIVYSDFWCNL